MVYETIFEYTNRTNVSGILGTWSYVANIVPIFTGFFLFFLWCIATFGTYFSQIRLRGFGDFIGSACVGSIFIAVVAIVMFMIPVPIIDQTTTIIAVVVGFVGVVGLFMNDRN